MAALRWLTLPRLIAAIVLIAVFVIAFRAPLDTDTYWHLRAGQWQVEHRALLFVDEFSSTRAGQPWINLYWLAQIVMYGLYVSLGDLGLALFTAILASAGMAFIYPLLSGDALQRAFVTILAAFAAALFWSARPQMISFLFSAVVLNVLWRFTRQGTDRLWIIPALMIPWANMHPGFAIGFILLALVMIGEAARWFLSRVAPPAAETEPPSLKPLFRLAIIGLVSAAALLINPYGIDTLLHPFRTVGIGVLRDFIQEWASPDFHQPQAWPFAILLVGTLVCAGLSSRRLDVRDGVLLAGTAAAALLAGRNVPTFAIAAAPVLSAHLDSWLADHRVRLNSARVAGRGVFLTVNWLLLVVVIGGGLFKMAGELLPERLSKARAGVFPVEAVRVLETSRPPVEMFNSYNWGGYLLWAARDYPVYVDGRTDLYDDAFVRDYLKVYYAQPGWADRLAAQHINTVLIEASSPLAQVLALSKGWTPAYSDSMSVIFVRDDPIAIR